MRIQYGPWQPCWISDQCQKHKSGRGQSNEHFWQVWFKSVQWFQRRRFKCEKLTDGRRRRTPSHDKSSHGLWLGELKKERDCLPFANIWGVLSGIRLSRELHGLKVKVTAPPIKKRKFGTGFEVRKISLRFKQH